MAGGLGTRLRPFTQIIPKPLLPVGEKSVLEITISKLKFQGFDEIILAVSYKSDLFESYFGNGSKYGVKISYSKERKKLGTAGPLLLLKKKLTEPFLVINGDILTNMDFGKLTIFHTENKADLTLVTKIVQLPLHYGVVEKSGKVVKDVKEKHVVESEINAGIYYLSPSTLEFIPWNREFTMTELMKELIKNKKNVLAYPLKEYWLDIGQLKDYDQAQKDIKEGLI